MKKFWGFALALAMMVSLAGCGSTKGSGETGNVTEGGSGEKYSYVIGHYGGVTGQVATAGTAGLNAIKLAIKQWNENGGVLGGQIGFEFYDDGATTEGAVKGVSYLIDDRKVDGIIASQLSGNIQATGDLVEAAKIPEVGTGMNPAWLQKGWKYLFRSLANSEGGAAPLVDAMEALKVTDIGTLIYQDDGNISANNLVMAELKKRGTINIVTEEQAMVGETDWTGALSSILSKKPNGVIIFAQGEQGSLMVKQVRSLGYTGYIFGCETMSMPDIRNVAGSGADGVVFFTPHCIPDSVDEASTEKEREFLAAYEKEYGSLPAHDVAYRAYDATNVLLTGVKEAGTKDGPAVRDTIANMKIDLLAGSADYSKFDNGECLSGQKVYIIHKGKNVLFSDFLKENPIDTYK
ncbi:MAG TPA: ABC transporter substrate-binding protein [Clostridiales bacterium]|nr:ABC transporter substrate-binding protein [Clostridiales bacterium]